MRAPREARRTRASEQARERTLTHFAHGSRTYEGREVRIEMLPNATQFPFQNVTIRQGVAPELIDEASDAQDDIDRRIKPFLPTAQVAQETERNRTAIS